MIATPRRHPDGLDTGGDGPVVQALWQTLTSEPGVSVALLDEIGTVLFANDETKRIFFEHAPEEIVGKRLSDLGFPKAWIDERLGLFQRMKAEGHPLLLRTVWQGHQQFSWMRMIPAEEGDGGPRFLVITRRIPAGQEAERLLASERSVVESDVIRLGELDALSPRELEVLALLGQGLSIKEIARTLHRSVKTIERHRGSIGTKLQMSKGLVIADVAREAGLLMDDAARKRV
jgi:DNA-binding CsgD family transcriptional regulator